MQYLWWYFLFYLQIWGFWCSTSGSHGPFYTCNFQCHLLEFISFLQHYHVSFCIPFAANMPRCFSFIVAHTALFIVSSMLHFTLNRFCWLLVLQLLKSALLYLVSNSWVISLVRRPFGNLSEKLPVMQFPSFDLMFDAMIYQVLPEARGKWRFS